MFGMNGLPMRSRVTSDAGAGQLGIQFPHDSGRISKSGTRSTRYDAGTARKKSADIAARQGRGNHPAMLVSAVSGEGIDALLATIDDAPLATYSPTTLRSRTKHRLPPTGRERLPYSWLHPQRRGSGRRRCRRAFDMTRARVIEDQADIVVNRSMRVRRTVRP